MALAVPFSPPAMDGEQPGPGAGPGMHPFFTTQRGRSREPAGEGVLELESMTDGASDLPSGPKKAKRTRIRSQEKGTGAQQSMLKFGQRPIVPKESPNADDTAKENEDAEGVEAPEAPRKRQRMESLERPTTPKHGTEMHPLGWEEQLIQAGFAGSSPSQPVLSTMSAGEVEKDPAGATHANSMPESTTETSLDVTVGKSEVKTKTPPKKIIKLRMDGKLASPKAKEDGVKKTRGGRKSAETAKLEQRLVVLKYGSDEASRLRLGPQIEDILSRPLKVSQPDQLPKQEQPNPKPAQAKATHPFFMGKVARVKLDHAEPSAPEDSDLATYGAERPKSPTKPKGPSKSSWAGFGSSFTKLQRPLGAIAAIWPPKDMVHVRGTTNSPLQRTPETPSIATLKKLKGSATRIETHEEVLSAYQGLASQSTKSRDSTSPLVRRFHRPVRKLLTGDQLVTLVRDQLACPEPQDGHPAVAKLFKEARVSLSAFDRFECESQEWAHKYAPKRVVDVLCEDDTMLLLRDWIVGLTVNAVNSGSGASNVQQAAIAKKLKARAKKKRKISDGLDDFIVSSEDELADEVTDPEDDGAVKTTLPRLSQRNIHRAKALVLTGPHGSGKTTSVYAAAQELGFEVFEINAGTRRSGRDIMDRVGDMTRNHLVRQLPDEEDQEPKERASPAPDAQAEVESGRQSTMNSFFKAQAKPKAKKKQSKLTKEPPKKPETPKKPSRKQKQSLILLEEVDVLFEEDKLFWSTVLTLLLSSRRPVIMTCTDESTLPFADMIDVATLRVAPPPEELVVDYLLLLAANEGHLILRDAMTRLFLLSGQDLRASIAQLEFLCQMALGDTKGGLEWMLIRSNVQESHNEQGEALRVVSESTFTRSMTTLMPDRDADAVNPRKNIDEELYLLQDVYSNWQLEPEEWINAGVVPDASTSIQDLRRFEAAADGLSCADILPGMSFLDADCARVDATYPALSDKQRSSYPDGIPLLDTPLVSDPTSLSTQVALTLQLLSRNLRGYASALSPAHISTLLSQRRASVQVHQRQHASFLSHTLSALVLPSPTYLGHTSPSRLPATLARVLAADIAPYVRSIVCADLKLEATRLQLSGLLSEGGDGGGGAPGKKARTTRASRAALEGGRKESTRRERWFRTDLNYRDVRRTGVPAWEEAGAMAHREREREREVDEQRERTERDAATTGEGEQVETVEDGSSGEGGAKARLATCMQLD